MRGSCLHWLFAFAAGAAAGCWSNEPAPAPEAHMKEGLGKYWDDLPEMEGGPELLAGRWVVMRVEYGELAAVPGLPFAGIRDATFADGKCTLTIEQPDLGQPPQKADLPVRFDPTATPKGFELTGPGFDRPWRWIYKLTRQGQLLLAFRGREDGQPAGFDPTRYEVMLLVCDRVPR